MGRKNESLAELSADVRRSAGLIYHPAYGHRRVSGDYPLLQRGEQNRGISFDLASDAPPCREGVLIDISDKIVQISVSEGRQAAGHRGRGFFYPCFQVGTKFKGTVMIGDFPVSVLGTASTRRSSLVVFMRLQTLDFLRRTGYGCLDAWMRRIEVRGDFFENFGRSA